MAPVLFLFLLQAFAELTKAAWNREIEPIPSLVCHAQRVMTSYTEVNSLTQRAQAQRKDASLSLASQFLLMIQPLFLTAVKLCSVPSLSSKSSSLALVFSCTLALSTHMQKRKANALCPPKQNASGYQPTCQDSLLLNKKEKPRKNCSH